MAAAAINGKESAMFSDRSHKPREVDAVDHWDTCAPWLTESHGAAGEIFIYDLKGEAAPALADKLKDGIGPEGVRELLRDDARDGQGGLNASLGRLLTDEIYAVNFYLRAAGTIFQAQVIHGPQGGFCLELVFWPDAEFPAGQPETFKRERLKELIAYAQDLCAAGDGRKVIVTGEWNRDPYLLETFGPSFPMRVVYERA
jgi:hypothetical protein